MRLIPLIIASLVFYSCASQKNTRVYAYRQPVLQGAKPTTVIDEKGRETEMPVRERPANFFIYLEMPPADVEMKTVWIKQKPYVANYTIVSTPVVIMPQVRINNAGDTLVKATRNRVFQISPGKPMDVELPRGDAQQQQVKDNELVIHCVVNGKQRYYALASIKNLPPLALQ
jgi:hypothetical protein